MFEMFRRVWEFSGKEMTSRDNFYCMWGYYPEDSPYKKKVSVAEEEPVPEIIPYSSVDEGDDPALRRWANKKVDELKSVYGYGLNPRRVTWDLIYDLMDKFAAVDFREATDKFIAKKKSEGREVSPTGYSWSWLNLAVSNAYWKNLLKYCIELAEKKAAKRKV